MAVTIICNLKVVFFLNITGPETDVTQQPLLNTEKCVNNTCRIINVNASYKKEVVINLNF